MILSIDTSSDPYKFALYLPKKLEKEYDGLRDDKKDALFFIDKILKQNKLDINNINAIAVFRGPGSFTGVRVGISIANALSFAQNIPVFGFSGEKYQGKPLLMAKDAAKGKLRSKKIITPIY